MFVHINKCLFSSTVISARFLSDKHNKSTETPPPLLHNPRQHTNGCYILVIASLLTNGCEVSWGHYLSALLLFLIEFRPSVVPAALWLTSRTSRCKLMSPRTTFMFVCTSLHTSLGFLRVCWCVCVPSYDYSCTFVCMCEPQNNILEEKLANLWLGIIKKRKRISKNNHTQRVMDSLRLKPGCIYLTETDIFSFSSLFHVTI